jgi:hypothetical protein
MWAKILIFLMARFLFSLVYVITARQARRQYFDMAV